MRTPRDHRVITISFQHFLLDGHKNYKIATSCDVAGKHLSACDSACGKSYLK